MRRACLLAAILLLALSAPASAADWTRAREAPGIAAGPASNVRGDVILGWAESAYGQPTRVFGATRQPDGSYLTQELGQGAPESAGWVIPAVDALGNATVIWAAPDGVYAARHAAGEPFGDARPLSTGHMTWPMVAAGTATTNFAWVQTDSVPSPQAQDFRCEANHKRLQVAAWGPADPEPRITTADARNDVMDPQLQMNARDDALLTYRTTQSCDWAQALARSTAGGPFTPLTFPEQSRFGRGALTDDGGMAATWGYNNVGYLTPEGTWIHQGTAEAVVDLAIDAGGTAWGITWRNSREGDGSIGSVRWRPGVGEAQPGPLVTDAFNTGFDDVARNASGGVTVLTHRPYGYGPGLAEPDDPVTAEVISFDAVDARSSTLIEEPFEGQFGSGPLPGELFTTFPRGGDSRFALWTRNIPPPPPPVLPPSLDVDLPETVLLPRKRVIRARVGCPQSCEIALAGVGSRGHVEDTDGVEKRVLKLRITAPERRRLRRALRRSRKVRVQIRATATFASGRQAVVRRKVTVRRNARRR